MSSDNLMETDQSQSRLTKYSIDGAIQNGSSSTTTTPNNAVWFDLKPDRNLLDSNFEGYKLSLDSFAQYKLDLHQNNHKLDTYNFIESDASKHKFVLYQHLKLFGMQNLLIANPYNDINLYYFDLNQTLIRIVYNNASLNTPATRMLVPTSFKLPNASNPERTNVTMRFVSENLAIVFDGFNTLYIIQLTNPSGNFSERQNWSTLFTYQINETEITAILRDAVLYENNFHILLLNVIETTSGEDSSASDRFNTIVNWLTIEQTGSGFNLRRVRKLNCFNSVPDYITLETNGQSVYVAGPEFIKFTYDSDNSANIINKKYESSVEMKPSNGTEVENQKCEKFYSWTQTNDEISMSLMLSSSERINKSDLKINLSKDFIEIFYLDKQILSGHLSSNIKVDESTWTLNTQTTPNQIEFLFSKAHQGQTWLNFLRDQSTDTKLGEYKMSDEQKGLVNQIQDKSIESKSLFTLEQQIEECDGMIDEQQFSTNSAQSEENFLMLRRLDGQTHQATHKSYINENKYLFDVKISANKMSSLCLRHDVDGVLWQPHRVSAPAQQETVWLTHDHSFLAFGYVQASKQEAKFRSCPPDCSYVCVVDTRKHIYLYKQSSEKVETQLRNRKSGQVISHVAKQFLVSLESDQEIYGVYCSNEYLVVLLADACYLYKVNYGN
jgi:hypothetical protein